MDIRTKKADHRHTSVLSSNEVTALVACSAFLLFGLNNVETTALPSYVMTLGAGPLVAGLQNSLFVFAAVALRIALERTVKRRGSRFAMIAGALGYAVPCLALAHCTDLWQVVILRLMLAFGLALFQPSVAQYLASAPPASNLGRRVGVVRFATTASLMAGPAIMFPLASCCGYKVLFVVLSLVGACGAAIALVLPRDRENSNEQQGQEEKGAHRPATATKPARSPGTTAVRIPPFAPFARSLLLPNAPRLVESLHISLRKRALLIAEPFALALGYSVVMNFGQTLAQEALATDNDGLLFVFMSAGGIIASPLAGWTTDRLGAKRSTAGAIALNSLGLLLMALGRTPPTVFAGAFFFGMGYFGASAALIAAAGASASRSASTFLARQQSALDMGMVAGGLLAGAMMQTGCSVFAVCLTASAVIGTSLVVWSMIYPNEKGSI